MYELKDNRFFYYPNPKLLLCSFLSLSWDQVSLLKSNKEAVKQWGEDYVK